MIDNMNTAKLVDYLSEEIKKNCLVGIEASGRHVHLSKSDLEALFGVGYQLTKSKELSQPNQYACQERITVKGPKGELKNVIILAPIRSSTQIEVSLTDCRILGIDAPIRESGKIENSAPITLINGNKQVMLNQGLIVAERHLHITPKDAQKFNLTDKEIIKLKVFSKRPLTFGDVLVRVSDSASTIVHIDYDEANACGFQNGDMGLIIKS